MMPRSLSHREVHLVHRIGWLRAAVLGANDGLVSTASLIVGVAAASSGKPEILVAGLAGLAAGAMSMAAGEYVSVSSQSDTENADLERERRELANDPAAELRELAEIYKGRGVDPDLARQMAEQLTASDALTAHARDELGITEAGAARPAQAALTSAATFAVGAALPLAMAVVTPVEHVIVGVSVASVLFLAVLGALSAWTGGAPLIRGTLRVGFWGIAAMAVTAAIGRLFGATVT
jgi:VIT1/CCC1 family predicted Fe2+/Mn2+ transporter